MTKSGGMVRKRSERPKRGGTVMGIILVATNIFFLRVSSVYISPLSWQFLVRSMKTNAAGWRRNREKGNPESFPFRTSRHFAAQRFKVQGSHSLNG